MQRIGPAQPLDGGILEDKEGHRADDAGDPEHTLVHGPANVMARLVVGGHAGLA